MWILVLFSVYSNEKYCCQTDEIIWSGVSWHYFPIDRLLRNKLILRSGYWKYRCQVNLVFWPEYFWFWLPKLISLHVVIWELVGGLKQKAWYSPGSVFLLCRSSSRIFSYFSSTLSACVPLCSLPWW